MTTATFNPTDEQLDAIMLAEQPGDLIIEALAGAGKTSTLKLIAGELVGQRGQYVAFNKKIVTDAKSSFPSSVQCSTAHSLAYRAVGYRYRPRMDPKNPANRRRNGSEVARSLGLDPSTPIVIDAGEETHELSAERVASMAAQTVERFCQTADREIGVRHVPFARGLDRPGTGSYPANDQAAVIVAPLARKIWESVQDPDDFRFKFTHGHYLKMWELTGPVIDCDYILFDEAQDANPVMMSIVEAQAKRGVKLIWVGDTHQQIYSFTGAVNAMARVNAEHRTYLTQSFRFGPEIAGVANAVLGRLGAGVQVTGSGPAGSVGPLPDGELPDVYLSRTNAGALGKAMDLLADGHRVYIQGGMDQVVSFCKAAIQLIETGKTSHPEISCFSSWSKVIEYVDAGADPAAADLRLMVGLVEHYGAEELIRTIEQTSRSEQEADVTVSTAHKSKGAEWDRVELIGDFPDSPEAGELRLLYVAVTRAKLWLDHGAVDIENKRASLLDLLAGFDPQGAGSIDPDDDDDADPPAG